MTQLHIHKLTGCAPIPLASYLKALGVLRLISAQADGNARGWWTDDTFYLATALDEQAVLDFFLNDYCPTPLIAPWNGGSGFYPKDKHDGIEPLAESPAPRFAPYRVQIGSARQLLGGREKSPKDEEKEALIRRCRDTWRATALEWLQAAIAIGADGGPVYPALLGTGGNDGRLDFTNNFMQRLVELFNVASPLGEPQPGTGANVRSALFSETSNILKKGKAIGQFSPGQVGGANATTGFEANSLINPFDFVLMLEGAVLFTAGVTRTCSKHALPQAAAPFAVRSRAVGYGSAATADEGARGEQWMPLWRSPLVCSELTAVLREGRCQVKRHTAERPLDFARAVARMSVARGLTEFQRYGYIERNGQANLATPLERWRVQPQPHQELLDEVAPWVDTLRRAGSDQQAPAGIRRAARNCEEAMMACCRNGHARARWLELLVALGNAEQQLLRSPRFSADPKKRLRPIPALQGPWLPAVGMERAEVRLALAFAALVGVTPKGTPDYAANVRRHFVPLDRQGRHFLVHGDALANGPDVEVNAPDFERLAGFVMRRRILMMQQQGGACLPLTPCSGRCCASLTDIHTFLAGDLDDALMLALIRPFAALRFNRTDVPEPTALAQPNPADYPLHALCKLCYLSAALKIHGEEFLVRTDPAIFQRLATGDAAHAQQIACRRLNASGLRPYLSCCSMTAAESRRTAAALAFPISQRLATWCSTALTRPALSDNNAPITTT